MMEEKEILDGNRIITEFIGGLIVAGTQENAMGSSYSKRYNTFAECQIFCDKVNMRQDVNKDNFARNYFPVHHRGIMKYRTSFDWLMPVVEKIKNMKTQDIITKMNGIDSVMPYLSAQLPIKRALLKVDITELFRAVVAFIKWFNEQKK